MANATALAYSDPLSFEDPVDVGGSAGRWFTGSPVEGYACDVCHQGSGDFELQVSGLPLDGYTPGASYEIQVRWPVELPHVAAALELTDEAYQTAGTLELPPPEQYLPDDLCTGEELGFPATLVQPTSDGRQVATMAECGARLTRVRWTAPQAASGTVWFSVALVQADDDDTPAGDNTSVARHALFPKGASSGPTRIGSSGCTVGSGTAATQIYPWLCLWLLHTRIRGPRRNR